MKRVINTEKKPIKMWLDNIEHGALEQAKNISNLPFAFSHIAIMPDSHQGYGMPIGAVLATKDVIVPNAVGVDIGCGMCAMRTSLSDIERDDLKKIHDLIQKFIPVGFNKHEHQQPERSMPEYKGGCEIVEREYEKARYQVGTLGGGNHFIEIQKGSDGRVWVMIHSGSRNIGYKVAQHYDKIAKKMNERYFSSVPSDWQLPFLPFNSFEGQSYKKEMDYCIEFAFANRMLMMEFVQVCISMVIHGVEYGGVINKPHNFAAFEHHFQRNLIIHRKGATRAYVGEIGMIPGSQGSKSFIVQGKGNDMSFKSCSHGAGRVMGRKQAIRELNLEQEKSKMDDLGVLHNIETVDQLDEADGAYKDIDEVMENQSDLVDILVELTPMAVIKG